MKTSIAILFVSLISSSAFASDCVSAVNGLTSTLVNTNAAITHVLDLKRDAADSKDQGLIDAAAAAEKAAYFYQLSATQKDATNVANNCKNK